MSARFSTIMYGTLDDLDTLLDREEMSESELRAVLQNLLGHIQALKTQLNSLECRVTPVIQDFNT